MYFNGIPNDRAGSRIFTFFAFSVSLCLCGKNSQCFCLAISYNTILAATPTLSDST